MPQQPSLFESLPMQQDRDPVSSAIAIAANECMPQQPSSFEPPPPLFRLPWTALDLEGGRKITSSTWPLHCTGLPHGLFHQICEHLTLALRVGSRSSKAASCKAAIEE